MKVLLINSVCGRQSTGRIVTDIKRELIKQGHECVIAYGEAASIADEDDYHIGSEIDRYIHAGMSRLFDCSGFCSRRATIKFIDWIKKYDPDIIHIHNVHGYYINVKLLFQYLKIANKKVIWTLHDCWAFTGHCAYFEYAKCEKWKSCCYACPQKAEYPARWFIDNSKNNYENKKRLFTGIDNLTIVTPSQWLKSKVEQSFLSEYLAVVINNGINADVFKPKTNIINNKYHIGSKRIVLGVAAVWDYRKGLDSFIELSKKLDADQYKIVLVGLSDKQLKELPDTILGIKATDSVDELAELYSAAYVFVNPTLEDNYPTTNLEAISCGTPVITYNTGGSPESAVKYGCVVDQNDVDGILNAIVGIGNIEKHAFCFDSKITVKKYISLYQKN